MLAFIAGAIAPMMKIMPVMVTWETLTDFIPKGTQND
jgi:hypothetical protein